MTSQASSSIRMLERLPSGVVCLDADGRMQALNAAAVRLFGCTSAAELVGIPIRTYMQFCELDTQGEAECIRDDGTAFPVEYETAPIDGGGRVIMLRDISERRAADRRKDERISLVSHELRTPLTAIRSSLGLLSSGLLGQLNDRGQSMVHIGITNTDRLIRLVGDLLDLERLNSGQAVAKSERCSVDLLMRQAAESVRALAADAQVAIEVGSCQRQVAGDPDRLQQVLINLLANAIKFSPPEGATVWLEPDYRSEERR